MPTLARLLVVLCTVAGAAGCTPGAFIKLGRNVEEANRTALVTGRVENRERDNTRIVVVALAGSETELAAYNYSRVFERDRYVLRIDSDRPVLLAAFADRNGNLRYDAGEPVAVAGQRLTATPERKALNLDLTLDAQTEVPAAVSKALTLVYQVKHKALPIRLGELADLEDVRFSRAYGEEARWAPMDFATEVGTGIFFLQPYDPARIPVVFVSGAGGYPQQWRSFIGQLDRNLYQPWVFLYPSGARLANSAQLLNGCMRALHDRYGFKTLFVTAHSMGGLVARGFILRSVHGDRRDYVSLFVSLATPWHGHEGAKYGVQYAPATIPSWVDMQVDSDYQKSVFSQTLGPHTSYYLFYGYDDPAIDLEKADDGVVSVSSQLYPQARHEAAEVLGFHADHEAILKSDEVLRTYNGILEKARTQVPGAQAPGRPN